MSSTYSTSLRVELIGSGDQAGTWGTTTDNNLSYIFDAAIAGYQTVSVTSANQALTYINGPISTAALNQSIYGMLRFTTTTTAAFAVYAPPVPKTYIIYNNSGYTATIYNSTVIGNTTAAGTGVAITDNSRVLVFSDGTNFYALQASSFTGILPVVNGGTGVSTSTGSGNNVLSTSAALTTPTITSATLVTPALGTPTSGTLTNCTFPTLNQNTTGNAATASTAVRLDTANFTILQSGSFLYIRYNGVDIVSISSAGTIAAG
jgi:hypothetical protein